MRLAVLADIHGNLPALEAVLIDLKQRQVDQVVNLGDCVSGPLWPAETCARLIDEGWPTVRGNHDRWVATFRPDQMGPSDRYAYDELGDTEREWLRNLPPQLRIDPNVVLFHACPDADDRYLLDDVSGGRLVSASSEAVRERLDGLSASVVLCGHSHQPRLWQVPEGPLVLNPGSVGCPAYEDPASEVPHVSETGTPHARYAILDIVRSEDTAVQMIALPYDYGSAARRAAQNGRPAWERALRTGVVGK